MGSICSKVDSIWLPGQSGKTRKIQDEIKMYKALSKLGGFDKSDCLHIVICSNNRSLVKQTNSRMKNDLYTKEESDTSTTDSEDDEDLAILRTYAEFLPPDAVRALKGMTNALI